jgi:alpha-glucosidase
MLNALLLSLRGSACIYQGEELGLPEAELRFEDLQDPYGIQFWPEFKGRDGCRTPMVWDRSKFGGFSTEKPWLPVPEEHLQMAVSAEAGDKSSVMTQYHRFLAFRKKHKMLVKGDINFILEDGPVLGFERTYGNETIVCFFNMTDQEQTVARPEGALEVLDDHGFVGDVKDKNIVIPAWNAFFACVA